MAPVVVLDNGASTIKTGVIIDEEDVADPRIVTNAIVRSKGDKKELFGHEFDECRNRASLHYRTPFERGYLTDWDAQKAIWDSLFSRAALNVNPRESRLLITEPYFNLPNIQDQYDQFIFEEYGFASYYRCTPAHLVPHGSLFAADSGAARPECMLIVDSGYSFTHVIPLMNGKMQWKSIRRVDIGGKLLTNYLKEMLSYRQLDLMGETFIANDVKEKSCFVSSDYKRDMELAREQHANIVQEYVLPNFTEDRPGRIRMNGEVVDTDDDVLRMGSERFAVPELLFRPSDIGLMQCGVAGAVSNSISTLPEDIQGMFWANIGLVGGNTLFSGFRERLMSELRSLAPVEHEVRVFEIARPVTEAYCSGVEFTRSPGFANVVVSRSEYLEHGSNICRRKFGPAICQSSLQSDEEARVAPITEKEKGKGRLGRSRSMKGADGEGGSTNKPNRPTRARNTAGR